MNLLASRLSHVLGLCWPQVPRSHPCKSQNHLLGEKTWKKRSICKTRDVQVKSSRPRLAKNNLSEDEDGRWNSKDVLGNIDSPLN